MFDCRTNRTPIERLGSIGFDWFLVRFRSSSYAGNKLTRNTVQEYQWWQRRPGAAVIAKNHKRNTEMSTYVLTLHVKCSYLMRNIQRSKSTVFRSPYNLLLKRSNSQQFLVWPDTVSVQTHQGSYQLHSSQPTLGPAVAEKHYVKLQANCPPQHNNKARCQQAHKKNQTVADKTQWGHWWNTRA